MFRVTLRGPSVNQKANKLFPRHAKWGHRPVLPLNTPLPSFTPNALIRPISFYSPNPLYSGWTVWGVLHLPQRVPPNTF